MALAETASLIVNLQLKGGIAGALNKQAKALNTFDSRLKTSESRAYRAGQQIGTGIRRGAALAAGGLAFLAGNVAIGLDSLVELEKQQAQTNAVLKSTKGIAGQTGASVARLAEKYEGLNAIIGDEFIRSGENMLLTFTNIRGKAFEPALKAILDLNTAMGKGPEGLTSTAIQVGKALNDPTTGLTALRRVGVSFTKEQVKRIKTLQKEGKLYEAQKIILGELNKEFGGSFAKQGQTTAGRIAKFKDSIEDLQRALAKALLPTLGNVADELTKFLADPAIIAGVENLGKQIAGIFSKENLQTAGRALGDIFNAAKAAAPGIIAAAKVAGSVVATAVRLFQSLPPEIQKLAIGAAAINKLTGGLVTNVAGGLIGAVLKQLAAGVVNVNGGVVNVNGTGVPGGAVPGGATKGLPPLLAVGIAGAVIAAAVPIGHAFADALPPGLKGEGGKGLSESQRRIGDALRLLADRMPRTTETSPGKAQDDRGNRGPQPFLGKLKDDLAVPVSKTTDAVNALRDSAIPKIGETTSAINMEKDAITAAQQANTDKVGTTSAAIQATTRSATLTNANIVAGATRSSASAIIAAIYAARPVINVNSVTRYTTINSRYGNTQPSAYQNNPSLPPGHAG